MAREHNKERSKKALGALTSASCTRRLAAKAITSTPGLRNIPHFKAERRRARSDFDDIIDWAVDQVWPVQSIAYERALTMLINELDAGRSQPGVKERPNSPKAFSTAYCAPRTERQAVWCFPQRRSARRGSGSPAIPPRRLESALSLAGRRGRRTVHRVRPDVVIPGGWVSYPWPCARSRTVNHW